MDFLNLSDITFRYKDAEGIIHETNMFNIMLEIGSEYLVPDDILRLRRYIGMLEIKIRGRVVWETS